MCCTRIRVVWLCYARWAYVSVEQIGHALTQFAVEQNVYGKRCSVVLGRRLTRTHDWCGGLGRCPGVYEPGNAPSESAVNVF